jgi:hypothetical protein
MEHLKLFSTRINIPRLIRVAEEYAHWKELVFLYVQVRKHCQSLLDAVFRVRSMYQWDRGRHT